MKLQNMIVIFIIIIIPIVVVFSYYIELEAKTITIQTNYDEKLIEATKEAVESLEVNTVEWNSEYENLSNSKRRDISSSINTFINGMASKLGIPGAEKENVLQYIPAIVYTMYDGYYIYTPTYVPEPVTDDKGVQLFFYPDASEKSKITTAKTQTIGTLIQGQPIFKSNTKIRRLL